MSSCLMHYSVLYGLNTLDACWIAVDVWSNSSRCRQYRSINLGRDAYICDHCLGYRHNYLLFYQLPNSNLFTHHMLCSREKPLVKTMGPGVYFTIFAKIQIFFAAIYFLCFYLPSGISSAVLILQSTAERLTTSRLHWVQGFVVCVQVLIMLCCLVLLLVL
jgi:hypothetical protein